MKYILFLLILSTVLISSCKKDNPVVPTPPEPSKAVTLSLVDVSCTEAFIKVTAADSVLPLSIILNNDDSTISNFTLTKTDTIVIDTTLQPNETYIYQTVEEINGIEEKSDTLRVQSLNVTSDNFTWQTYTFGDPIYGSSGLNDVTVIDENNIWAVGEIYNDTTGLIYNALHWNGSDWELKRISVQYQGNIITPPLFGVCAFSATDIWLSSGVPVHGDGENWIQYHLFDMGILGQDDGYLTKIWGTSSSNIYYVGTLGTIVYYHNGTWIRIESGTTTNINGIWGINDPATNNSLVLCTVSNRYQLGDHKLLSISDNTAAEYFPWPYTTLYGIWFNSSSNIFIVGGKAYVYKNDSLEIFGVPSDYYLTRVKGNDLNDVYIATAGAEILHFNGMNWVRMSDGIYGSYEGMDVKGNTVALAGYNIEGGMVGRGVVTIGKRY